MSFDSTFDYTGAISFIDDRVENTINVHISTIETQLSDLQAIDSAFDNLTGPKISSLEHTKNVYETMRDNLQTMKGEIGVVTGLDSGDKTTLYTFYGNAVAESVPDWMARMMFNTTSLLADAANVNASGTLTTDQKNALGEIICQNNPLNGHVHQLKRHFPTE